MNLLYLHSHDTGRAIQSYGYNVRTPHLQKLADEGIQFNNAHCAAPTCSPSRAALLTGETAHQAGMVGLAHRGGKLLHPERHIANLLAEHDYTTAIAGVSHVGHRIIADCGYKEINDLGRHAGGDEIAQFAVDFLKRQDASKPFFLDAGFVETHRTEWVCHGFNQEHHNPKDGDGDASRLQPPPTLPNTPECRRDWLDYVHSVERLDSYYGRILDALDQSGLADDTLVLATTDHGIAFPHHKCNLTAHGTGVLFILRAPMAFTGGRVSDALVSHLDFLPTLFDYMGWETPSWFQGKSLRPVIEDKTDVHHSEIFGEVTFHAAFEPKRNIRTPRWNYIRNFAAPHPIVLPNCDDGHSKRLLLANGWRDQIVPKEELYDLLFDPMERHNLAADPIHSTTVIDLRARLAEWMRTTNDPLLDPDPNLLPLPQRTNPWTHEQPDQPAIEWDTGLWSTVDRTLS